MPDTTKVALVRQLRAAQRRSPKDRFKLHGFGEIADMSAEEWTQECRRSGADFGPHLDDPTDPRVDAILAKGRCPNTHTDRK
jgi:hypothetical protein